MSDIGQFCYYLEIARWLCYSTIERHKTYLIRYNLRLLENWLKHSHSNIQYYKRDMQRYVANNTVYKRMCTIIAYTKYRNVLYDDYSIRYERIDNLKYQR